MAHLISLAAAGRDFDISETTLNWRALLALSLNLGSWAVIAKAVAAAL